MRLLITAGPTREYLDSVRFISNASSGKLGYAIASAAATRGHAVALITGPVELPPPEKVSLVRVVSADDMMHASEAEFATCDAAIMAAAVCDYRPATRHPLKLGKHERSLELELLPTPDICARLGAAKGGRVVIGFAMEDHDHRARAESKLRRKDCDAIILNSVSTAGADDAEIEILTARGGWQLPLRGAKSALAEAIICLTEELVRVKQGA